VSAETPSRAPSVGPSFRLLAALWPLVVCAFHARAAWPGMAFVGWDLRHDFFARSHVVGQSLRALEWPGWQRGVFMGSPLLGDPQAAIFDPATWLTLPWDAPRAATLGILVHLVVMGWGMQLWMRLRGLGPEAALLAAVVFALGGKQTVHLQHWTFAATTAWWPWMLAALEGFRRDGRGRWLLLAALASMASWFGGAAQLGYFGSLVALAYALALAPSLAARRPLDAVLALGAFPLGAVLAAPMLWPAAELAALGPRGAGTTYEFASQFRWTSRWGAALLVLPRAFGGRWPSPEMNLMEATGYVGVWPLALVAAAPWRRLGTWLFVLLGALGVALSFGPDAWLGLHRFAFDHLPGFDRFRVPTRALMVTSLAAAVASAEALEALRASASRGPAWRTGVVLVSTGVLALALPRLEGFPLDRDAGEAGAFLTVLLASLGVAWLFAGALVARSPRASCAWALTASLVCAADLQTTFGTWNDVAPSAGETPPLGDLAPWMPPAPSPRRVAVIAEWGQTANAALRWGWEGTTGYGPTGLRRVGALLRATVRGRLPASGPLANDGFTFPRPRPTSPLWPLFATPLVASDVPQDLPRLGPLRPEYPWRARLAAYEAAALPRVFTTGAWSVHDDASLEGPGLEAALSPAARGEEAVLAAPFEGLEPSAARRPPQPARAVRVLRDALEADLETERAGLAVVLDPWCPGWHATLDGHEVPLVRADYAFMAVPVPAGLHTLRLEYRNTAVHAGAAVSAAALTAWLAVLVGRRRARPRADR